MLIFIDNMVISDTEATEFKLEGPGLKEVFEFYHPGIEELINKLENEKPVAWMPYDGRDSSSLAAEIWYLNLMISNYISPTSLTVHPKLTSNLRAGIYNRCSELLRTIASKE